MAEGGPGLIVCDPHPASPPRSLELRDGLPHSNSVTKVRALEANSPPGLLPSGSLWTPPVCMLETLSRRRHLKLFTFGGLFSVVGGKYFVVVVVVTYFLDHRFCVRSFLPELMSR